MENNGMPQLPTSALQGAETVQPPIPPAMPTPPPSRKHIEVVAIANGFYDNHRKTEGDHFTVPDMGMCGSWMKCVDPKLEREHLAFMKAKKQKANSAAD